ncbi:hypothetical protein ACSSS7_000736 [Eimeria intestinalis]
MTAYITINLDNDCVLNHSNASFEARANASLDTRVSVQLSIRLPVRPCKATKRPSGRSLVDKAAAATPAAATAATPTATAAAATEAAAGYRRCRKRLEGRGRPPRADSGPHDAAGESTDVLASS